MDSIQNPLDLSEYGGPGFDLLGGDWNELAKQKHDSSAFSGSFVFRSDATVLIKVVNSSFGGTAAFDVMFSVEEIDKIEHLFGRVNINLVDRRKIILWSLTPARAAVMFWSHSALAWIICKKEAALIAKRYADAQMNISIAAAWPLSKSQEEIPAIIRQQSSIQIPEGRIPFIDYNMLKCECLESIPSNTEEPSDIASHVESGSTLIPSYAFVPPNYCRDAGLASLSTESVIQALVDSPAYTQSFFGELELIHEDTCPYALSPVLSDDVLHTQPFDESLFCKLVLENHRYTLAQLYDARHEAAEQKAKRWMKYGILAGVVTLNPLMPFFLSNQGRINASKGTRLEELIPDPHLMFMQDKYSFLKMTHGGTPMPQMRRAIFHPVITGSSAYLRIIPAALTQTSVIPLQVFKMNDAHFLRPVCAGIDPDQPNYNAQRIHRLYYHLRADGKWKDTGERIAVCGSNIDDSHRYRLYHFSSDSRELEYYYIDYQTEPGHVF